MTSTSNINDPAGVAALLEQLKSSTAWQELTNACPAPTPKPDAVSPPSDRTGPPIQVSSNEIESNSVASIGNASVASLLSQLQSISTNPNALPPSGSSVYPSNLVGSISTNGPPQHSSFTSSSATPRGSTRTDDTEDVSKLSFAQSLPIISALAEDAAFVSSVRRMKRDQEELERQLWTEREAIYTKYHEKYKVAQTKAQMIGTSVSQHEQDMMNDAFKKDIFKFDHDRVIPAWDGLLSRQQMELAQLKVPTMFVTGEGANRERQHQVVNVLETIVGSKTA